MCDGQRGPPRRGPLIHIEAAGALEVVDQVQDRHGHRADNDREPVPHPLNFDGRDDRAWPGALASHAPRMAHGAGNVLRSNLGPGCGRGACVHVLPTTARVLAVPVVDAVVIVVAVRRIRRRPPIDMGTSPPFPEDPELRSVGQIQREHAAVVAKEFLDTQSRGGAQTVAKRRTILELVNVHNARIAGHIKHGVGRFCGHVILDVLHRVLKLGRVQEIVRLDIGVAVVVCHCRPTNELGCAPRVEEAIKKRAQRGLRAQQFFHGSHVSFLLLPCLLVQKVLAASSDHVAGIVEHVDARTFVLAAVVVVVAPAPAPPPADHRLPLRRAPPPAGRDAQRVALDAEALRAKDVAARPQDVRVCQVGAALVAARVLSGQFVGGLQEIAEPAQLRHRLAQFPHRLLARPQVQVRAADPVHPPARRVDLPLQRGALPAARGQRVLGARHVGRLANAHLHQRLDVDPQGPLGGNGPLPPNGGGGHLCRFQLHLERALQVLVASVEFLGVLDLLLPQLGQVLHQAPLRLREPGAPLSGFALVAEQAVDAARRLEQRPLGALPKCIEVGRRLGGVRAQFGRPAGLHLADDGFVPRRQGRGRDCRRGRGGGRRRGRGGERAGQAGEREREIDGGRRPRWRRGESKRGHRRSLTSCSYSCTLYERSVVLVVGDLRIELSSAQFEAALRSRRSPTPPHCCRANSPTARVFSHAKGSI